MTQQPPSPLVQGAEALQTAEDKVEETLKVDIPDLALLLRNVALGLPGLPIPGVLPGSTITPAPAPGPVSAPARLSAVGLPVVT